MYNFEQSAGNLPRLSFHGDVLVVTSETRRGPHNKLWEDIVHVIKSSLISLNLSYLSFLPVLARTPLAK